MEIVRSDEIEVRRMVFRERNREPAREYVIRDAALLNDIFGSLRNGTSDRPNHPAIEWEYDFEANTDSGNVYGSALKNGKDGYVYVHVYSSRSFGAVVACLKCSDFEKVLVRAGIVTNAEEQ